MQSIMLSIVFLRYATVIAFHFRHSLVMGHTVLKLQKLQLAEPLLSVKREVTSANVTENSVV